MVGELEMVVSLRRVIGMNIFTHGEIESVGKGHIRARLHADTKFWYEYGTYATDAWDLRRVS